jgi:adenine-specific DNA glycosylase
VRGADSDEDAGTSAAGTRSRPAPVKELLLAWCGQNGRDLRWRRTRAPYAILVSEMMLQQYRVGNVELPP